MCIVYVKTEYGFPQPYDMAVLRELEIMCDPFGSGPCFKTESGGPFPHDFVALWKNASVECYKIECSVRFLQRYCCYGDSCACEADVTPADIRKQLRNRKLFEILLF
ncbi:hypothetical protein QR680_000500 [Steinernema hermaphroditum]|uniref:Uncharacterized protein n=1 Tax=Steinernema hermaphroditum TaxID=289476 RepID=A0AA39GUT5_9BILA|nr:hypothetical protein QR680_000500 [Steinernema hermaphroditum]